MTASPATTMERPAGPTRKRATLSQLTPAAQNNNSLRILDVAEGVTREDCQYQEFWKVLAAHQDFRPYDRIEVRGYDGTWRLEVTVMSVTPDGLDVHMDKFVHFKRADEPPDSDGYYTVRRAGGPLPYVVIRDEDKQPMPGTYATREAARFARAKLHPTGE